jgi:hypothetical protein
MASPRLQRRSGFTPNRRLLLTYSMILWATPRLPQGTSLTRVNSREYAIPGMA